ncbi:MAG: ABC transporter ATP-binding protein [Desulfobulbus sp.]
MSFHNFGYMEKGQSEGLGDIRLWRRILGYCSGRIGPITVALLLSLAVTAAALILPRLMQLGIDGYIIADALPTAERLSGLGRIALWFGLLAGGGFLAGFFQVLLLEWIGQGIMHRLRQELFTHLLTLELDFFHRQPAGRLVTRLTNDIQNLHEMFTSVLVILFNDGLKMMGIFVFLFLMNRYLALVMAIFIPLALLMTIVFSRLARERFRALRAQLSRLNSFWAESLAGIDVIQCFGVHARSSERQQGLGQEYRQRALAQIRLFAVFMPMIDLLGSGAVALIIWHGGGEVLRGQLTIGELAAFLLYMRLFFQPLRELSQKYSIVQAAMASAERIFQTLDIRPGMALPPSEPAPIFPATGGEIVLRNVVFSYSPEEPVLRGIDLRIAPGETVALVGGTGAGKSTLVSLLIRLYDPVSGSILLDGRDLREIPLPLLRQRIGLVIQELFFLPETVRANIVLDLPVDEQRLEDILARTGLERFIASLPQGLDTRIGDGARQLSMGEKQLLAFVRALYRDPAVLILDEATASVDTEAENLLEQALDEGFRGRTSLVIAHRLSTIRRVDRILVMDQGRIVEEGSHESLMAQNSLYRSLVRLDHGFEESDRNQNLGL